MPPDPGAPHVYVRTLGGFSVSVGGVEPERFSAQPVRSALLAHVAVERETTRERVLGLIWPDVEPKKARRRLNQLVLRVRQVLGQESVDTLGDVIAIGKHVTVDAHDFERAVQAGDRARALSLYVGPFLHGLILVDNPHYEAWAEGHRKHLAGLFARVATEEIEALRDAANTESALDLARRWLHFDPFDERANHELIALLGRAGRRADAVRHFEDFERSMSEAGLGDVSPRLRDLVGDLRAPDEKPESGVPEVPATAHTRARAAIALAVVPFEQLGDTPSSAVVAQGLTEEIVSRLTRLDRLRVVPRRSIERYVDAGYPSDVLRAELGVQSLLEGSVQELGGHIRVHARLISTADDRYVWQEDFEGSLDDLLELQARIAAGIASALSDDLSDEEASLVQSHSTTSRTAWMRFASAVSDLEGESPAGLERAISALESALERDPQFVAALEQLTDAYARLDEGRVHARFQGRTDELNRLRAALELSTRSGGQFVAISGPPGIGKSTLLRRFRAEKPEGRIMYLTRCRARGARAPFRPFAEAFREAMRIEDTTHVDEIRSAVSAAIDDLDPALAAHTATYHHVLGLPVATGDPEPGSAEELRRSVVVAITDLLKAITRRAPVVLAIEDWQWADEGSKGLLEGVRAILPDYPITLIVTYRTDEGIEWSEPRPRSMRLEPLTQSESDELICASFGTDDVSPELSDSVWELAGGNPFYAEEVCRTLSEGNFVATAGGVAHLARRPEEAPSDLHDVVRSRIEHGDRTADEAWTLGLLAVLGRDASIPLLQILAREDPGIMLTLSRLWAADLVASSGRRSSTSIGLRHSLTGDAALERSESRAAMHLRVGQALEELFADGRMEEHLEELAYHFTKGGDKSRASHYLELAGDRAFRSFSLAEARRLYRRALDGLGDDDANAARRAAVSFKWVEAGFLAAHPEQLDVLRRTLVDADRLDDAALRIRTTYWLGWVNYTLGNQRESIRLFEELERIAAELGDARFHAQVHLNLAYSLAAATEYTGALRHFEIGVEQRKFLPGPTRSRGLAYAYGYLGMTRADRGEISESRASFAEAFEIASLPERRSIEGSVRTQEAFAHAFCGDWPECEKSASMVRTIATELGGPYLGAMGLTLEGYAKERLDGDGLELLEEGVRELESSRAFLNMSWSYAALADARARRGMAEAARAAALSGLARAEMKDRLGEALAMKALARVEALRDDPDWTQVQRHIDKAIAISEQREADRAIADAFLCHAELLLGHGRKEEARAALEAAGSKLPEGLDRYDAELRRLSALAG